jgi:hypothetical protein
MKNSEMKALIESLQKTIEVQAETMKALLLIVAQAQHPVITLAPIPELLQPIINPQPWPPYMPFVGDPPSLPLGGTICTTGMGGTICATGTGATGAPGGLGCTAHNVNERG